MNTYEYDLSEEAEQEIAEIEQKMLENDRENERLRERISEIVDREDPPQ